MAALQHNLSELADSAANETKSSAGDKYETARAMLHIEQDKARSQIAELAAQQAIMESINPEASAGRIGLGSLVRSADVNYFLSTALGKIAVGDIQVIALSLQSPLGSKLKGCSVGDTVEMNGKTILIESVQ